MKIYTRKGDDGTTGLLYGGRVAKDSAAPTAYGTVDELQSFLGLARAEADAELGDLLVHNQQGMLVTHLEELIDSTSAKFEPPTEFVVPGQNRIGALLDVARTVARRAERDSLAAAGPGSAVVPSLNRLSDLLWTLARWQEGTSLPTRSVKP